jgi:hypothetical protein
MPVQVEIDPRFNGPPRSANGGYTCGLLAGLLAGDAAEVSLRRPPPLGEPLEARETGDGVILGSAEEAVAEGRRIAALDLEVPPSPDLRTAREAATRYPWRERHPYPSCFVCGPRRPAGDGLEVYAGPLPEGGTLCACTWTPAAEWGDEEGNVRPEIVWAALDCPSAVPAGLAGPPGAALLLARLEASLDAPVPAAEEGVVLAWLLGAEGRKVHTASAILGADGAVSARARALWILPRPG